jgi:hypothetical protein
MRIRLKSYAQVLGRHAVLIPTPTILPFFPVHISTVTQSNLIPLYNLPMNVSASFNVFRLITNPALCLPHATIPTFNHLPIPLENAFAVGEKGRKPDIRAIVLDKDNCFARPKENVVWGEYEVSNVHVLGALYSQPTQENPDYVCCVTVSFRHHVVPHTKGLDGKNSLCQYQACVLAVMGLSCHSCPSTAHFSC